MVIRRCSVIHVMHVIVVEIMIVEVLVRVDLVYLLVLDEGKVNIFRFHVSFKASFLFII